MPHPWGWRWTAGDPGGGAHQRAAMCFACWGCLVFATLFFYECHLATESHIWFRASRSSLNRRLCSECWINGVGLLQEWVKSFQTLVHVRLPALLMKRILPLLMLGSYNSVGLLIKWGSARSRDIMFPISACKWFWGGQNILLVQPVVCCSRDESHHLCGLLWPLKYELMKLVAKK